MSDLQMPVLVYMRALRGFRGFYGTWGLWFLEEVLRSPASAAVIRCAINACTCKYGWDAKRNPARGACLVEDCMHAWGRGLLLRILPRGSVTSADNDASRDEAAPPKDMQRSNVHD
jgi:hypothetical protein